MKRIALWGYGGYGRYMAAAIRRWWSGELEITALYDRRFAAMADAQPAVRDPARIPEDRAGGSFDAVMITVNLKGPYFEIRKQLAEWKIPVCVLGKEEDFLPAAAFRREDRKDLPRQEGYDVYAFRDLRGAAAIAPSSGVLFLSDGTGKLLRDSWEAYWTKDNHTHQFDYPVRFDRPQPAIPMAGEYCILAKLYSCNYWHFLFEGMDCVQLLEESGFSGRYVICDRKYAREVMLQYGIREDRLLSIRDFAPGKVYSFERVIYPKLRNNDRTNAARVLKRLSDRLKEKLALDPGRYPSRLYVERAGTRKLLNGRAFAEKNGFAVIDPEKLSVREQMAYFYNADLILSAHGANSANLLCMRRGTVLVETFGKYWVNYCNAEALRELGIFYLPLVEGPILPDPAGPPADPDADYAIPEGRLSDAVQIALRILHSEET